MSEHHEFCQLRIDGLKDTIATLTAQRDAAENELADAKLWGFPDHYNWYEDLIEWLGDWHDEELCDGPRDLIAEVKEKFAAAEKVCGVADGERDLLPPQTYLALTEWRRTKEGA